MQLLNKRDVTHWARSNFLQLFKEDVDNVELESIRNAVGVSSEGAGV